MLLDLGIFHQNTYASVRCPQLLLNDLQDFYETLWSVRIYNGDVHIVRNFILDNFCTRYECLDLGIFHQYTYASVRCPQLFLNDLQDFYETLWSVRSHNGDVHIVGNFVLANFCTRYERLDLGIFHQCMH